jgi:predicted DNA-binding mobile mystery protein A
MEALAPPEGGWIRSVRQSLGMSTRQLAQRIGVERATAAEFERSEAAGTITLNTLEKAASGLGATLVYALVPNQSLDATLRGQAGEKASKLLARVSTTMGLELQNVDSDAAKDSRDDVVERLIRELPRDLWDP